MKTVNYTTEQTATLIEGFKAGETVEALATLVGRSTRSVIAKLSKEGVYTAKTKAKGEKAVTKADLVAKIAAGVGIENAKVLESLEKATKEALAIVAAYFDAEESFD